MSMEEMASFKEFDVKQYPEFEDSYKMFLFSYYARGMNFADMSKLKWTDNYNGRINYHRAKTGGYFTIKIRSELQSLLDYFMSDSIYVFPILKEDVHITPKQIMHRNVKVLKKYNRYLKEIAKICNITTPVTSYTARHQYATTLKHNNVEVGVISEGMGHVNINVTNAYLKKFADSVTDEADKVL